MSKVISIVAPVLSSDTPVGFALEQGRANNAFGVVEQAQGAYRFHTIHGLEQAATLGRIVTLGNLHGHGIEIAPNPVGEVWGSPDGDVSLLKSLNTDVAIRSFGQAGGVDVASIVGLATNKQYLPTIIRNSWYECGVSLCPDKVHYAQAGTCAYNHTLVKKP